MLHRKCCRQPLLAPICSSATSTETRQSITPTQTWLRARSEWRWQTQTSAKTSGSAAQSPPLTWGRYTAPRDTLCRDTTHTSERGAAAPCALVPNPSSQFPNSYRRQDQQVCSRKRADCGASWLRPQNHCCRRTAARVWPVSAFDWAPGRPFRFPQSIFSHGHLA